MGNGVLDALRVLLQVWIAEFRTWVFPQVENNKSVLESQALFTHGHFEWNLRPPFKASEKSIGSRLLCLIFSYDLSKLPRNKENKGAFVGSVRDGLRACAVGASASDGCGARDCADGIGGCCGHPDGHVYVK